MNELKLREALFQKTRGFFCGVSREILKTRH